LNVLPFRNIDRFMESKKISIAVILLIIGALSIMPSLSFAARLSTTCNIFYGQQTDKAGPCHQKASPLKDKNLETGFTPTSEILFDVQRLLITPNPTYFSLVPSADLWKVTPLRC
jgi:hypothetical protein